MLRTDVTDVLYEYRVWVPPSEGYLRQAVPIRFRANQFVSLFWCRFFEPP